MSHGQTLLLLPCNDNKLQKQNLAISFMSSSEKLGIDDEFFCKFLSLYGSKSNVLTTSHVYAYGRYMRSLAVLCGSFHV